MVGDFSIHRLTMIVVVGERVVNRCKREMGIVLEKLLGGLAVQQCSDDNRSDRDTSTLDPRAASADCGVTDDVGMRYGSHGVSLTNLRFPCNRLPVCRYWRNSAMAWPSSVAWVDTQLGLEGQGRSRFRPSAELIV